MEIFVYFMKEYDFYFVGDGESVNVFDQGSKVI